MESFRHDAPKPVQGQAFPSNTMAADPHAVLLADLLREVLAQRHTRLDGVQDLAGALRHLASALDAVAGQAPSLAAALMAQREAGRHLGAPVPMPAPHTPPGYRSMAVRQAA
ncbi:hypothetical protein [Roseococcus thiosulfatophilus]|uniref:hypothetical protein n=1 Tax=Roseococcus thiosulfatophilus TaxID=35813 RepID=UPI001A8C3684|nr:hypothetical protein [Roseococcus thiosulfatophilus]